MYEFTLLKSMFFELDKYKIEGVTQTKEKQRTFAVWKFPMTVYRK